MKIEELGGNWLIENFDTSAFQYNASDESYHLQGLVIGGSDQAINCVGPSVLPS